MNPAAHYSEPPGFRVTVDRVLHQPDAQTPPERPHCFVYFITIHNGTATDITIRGRKWVVTSGTGEVTAVEGEGVVGQMPRIPPGESFSEQQLPPARHADCGGGGELSRDRCRGTTGARTHSTVQDDRAGGDDVGVRPDGRGDLSCGI